MLIISPPPHLISSPCFAPAAIMVPADSIIFSSPSPPSALVPEDTWADACKDALRIFILSPPRNPYAPGKGEKARTLFTISSPVPVQSIRRSSFEIFFVYETPSSPWGKGLRSSSSILSRTLIRSGPPKRMTLFSRHYKLSSDSILNFTWSKIMPESTFSTTSFIVMPVCFAPSRSALIIGDGPRYCGSIDG